MDARVPPPPLPSRTSLSLQEQDNTATASCTPYTSPLPQPLRPSTLPNPSLVAPNPQFLSAPLLPIATTQQSTPTKRKAGGVPLSAVNDDCDIGTSDGKRRRTTVIAPLLQRELRGAKHISSDFVSRFILNQTIPYLVAETEQNAQKPEFAVRADGILERIMKSKSSAGSSIKLIKVNQEQLFVCYPPAYSNSEYPQWFCQFANDIRKASLSFSESMPTTSQDGSGGGQLIWCTAKDNTLLGIHNNDIRPDFILIWNPAPPNPPPQTTTTTTTPITPVSTPLQWRSVLIIGEHQSKGKNPDQCFIQLATYAEQVFLAQPFRMYVLGILTSNVGPKLTLWRFDRSGAIGSLPLNFGMSSLQLHEVVNVLATLPEMSPQELGFHTESIVWDRERGPYPLDHEAGIKVKILLPLLPQQESTSTDSMEVLVPLKAPIFLAPGIVTRGTRVWTATLPTTGQAIAIKYSWRNINRIPEGDLYKVACMHKVIGLATLLSSTTYENILADLHHNHHHEPGTSSNLTDPAAYITHMKRQNRILSRMVLTPTGKPLSDPKLSPLQVARGLLAGLVGHASLFFKAGVLHRDISPNNIIVFDCPEAQIQHLHLHSHSCPSSASATCTPCSSQKSTTNGNDPYAWIYPPTSPLLAGCLIDLDYAIKAQAFPSGALDRTGTYPFIAINILSGKERHRYRHDLESFFYVMLWTCCYPVDPPATPLVGGSGLKGQNEQIREDTEADPPPLWPPTDPLGAWRDGDEISVINHKSTCIIHNHQSFDLLLARFRKGFEGFKGVAERFRRSLWGLKGLKRTCLLFEEGVGGCSHSVGAGPGVHGCGSSKDEDGDAEQAEQINTGVDYSDGSEDDDDVREWLLPEEVRIGVHNKQAFVEIRRALEKLVRKLEVEAGNRE